MNEMGTKKIRCVTGLNLPMLIEVVSDRDEQDLPHLEETALAAGGKGMVSLAEKIFRAKPHVQPNLRGGPKAIKG